MLEPPAINPEEIIAHLYTAYGLQSIDVALLPTGADPNTAVYRVIAPNPTTYFLKLRRGQFSEATVTVPDWLAHAGMPHLIAPLRARNGKPWARFPPYVSMLYPFVEGESGWNVVLTEGQWKQFGIAIRELHTRPVPNELVLTVPHETYTAMWRDQVTMFLEQAEQAFDDPVAAELADLLHTKRSTIERLISRAEQCAVVLIQQPLKTCLCHGDIHAGNLLIDTANQLYIVDWDTLIIAPKERDLMFIGAGIGGVWNSTQEAQWFYQGYGQAQIDSAALSYYRCKRIVQDIAVSCEQLLLTNEGGANRRVAFEQLAGQFESGSVVEIALKV